MNSTAPLKSDLNYDMLSLLEYIHLPSLSLISLSDIIPVAANMNWAASIDLASAYRHVKVPNKYIPNLVFVFKVRIIVLGPCLSGLRTHHLFFLPFLSPVIRYLRVNYDMIIFIYLDDILILGASHREVASKLSVTRALLTQLGFLLNNEKSDDRPVQVFKYLGVQFDLKRQTLSHQTRLISKVMSMGDEITAGDKVSRRGLERYWVNQFYAQVRGTASRTSVMFN